MDNVVVFQEVLHTMRQSKRQKGYRALKIDLEKAYDRLNWDFIEWVLKQANLSSRWITNIMNCIKSSSISVLWNGEKLDSVCLSQGFHHIYLLSVLNSSLI